MDFSWIHISGIQELPHYIPHKHFQQSIKFTYNLHKGFEFQVKRIILRHENLKILVFHLLNL